MSVEITYTKKGDKYVFCKDGLYFALTDNQVVALKLLLTKIEKEIIK